MEYIFNEKRKLHPNSTPIKYIITNKGCWQCISYKPINSGYIRTKRNQKEILIHRYSYEIYKGKIPDGMVVMHTCDNRKCINPEHLELGTYKDNTADMVNKGRHGLQGEKHKISSRRLMSEKRMDISIENLYQIKEMLLNKHSMQEIMDKFNISRPTIYRIKSGKHWSNKEILNGNYNDWIKERDDK